MSIFAEIRDESLQLRERRNNEVRRLREEISEKRLAIYTVTKGIPFNRLEVRPEDQIPQNSFEKLLSSPSKKPSVAVPLPYMQAREGEKNDRNSTLSFFGPFRN